MQEMRPAAERELPQWERDALDRERSRPRNIDDVLKVLNALTASIADIQARIHRIEDTLNIPDRSR